MKTLLLTAPLGATSAPPALRLYQDAPVHSHLLMVAGQQFVPGGGPPGGFVVAGQNTGPVAVEVLERPTKGPAGWRARLSFGLGSTALLRNASTRRAVLDVDVLNGQGLTMTHEPITRK